MEKIEKEIISEWEEFYIDYKIFKKILYPLKILENKKIQNMQENSQQNINNIENPLNENLLLNNEQNEEENENKKIKGLDMDNIFNKYITQLNLEINKFSFFNNLLQNKRHFKRFDEIIQQ